MGNSSSGEVCGCCIPIFDRISIGDGSAAATNPPVVRTVRLERNEVYHFEMSITPQIRDELRKKYDGMVSLIEVDIHVDEGELKQAFMAKKGRFPNGKKRSLWPQAGLKDQSDPDGKLGRLQDAHGGMTFRMSAIATNEFEVADYYISLLAGIRAKCHVQAYIVREAIRAPVVKPAAHASMTAMTLNRNASDDEKRGGGNGIVNNNAPARTDSDPYRMPVANGGSSSTFVSSQPPAAQLPPSMVSQPVAPVVTAPQPVVRAPGTIVIRTAPGLAFPSSSPSTSSATATAQPALPASPLTPTAVPLSFAPNTPDPYASTPRAASFGVQAAAPPPISPVPAPAPVVTPAPAPVVVPAKVTVVAAVNYDKPDEDFEI